MKLESIIESIYQSILNLNIDIKKEEVILTPSKVKEHGDVSTNIALRLAKKVDKTPMEVANLISKDINCDDIDKIEVVAPGFINIFIKEDNIVKLVGEINKLGEHYGDLNLGNNEKTLVEYVSANPTGALHLGHARGAAIGDSLVRILKKGGYNVTSEYYVNDAGNQIDNLGKSLQVRYLELFGIKKEFPENGYHGEDIIAFAKYLKDKYGDKYVNSDDIEFFKTEGCKLALNNIIKDLSDFRVAFDIFTSEKDIRKRGLVNQVLDQLKPYCYENEGATYLNTTKDGDDKDRVIIKSDGSMTYLLPDIAYHKDKFDRGYQHLIDLFGADHHGYISRLKSSMKSLGYNPDKLDVELVQMVRLFKDGQEFKMSKRTGNAVSLKELCEEVGVDAVRYFFVSRSSSQHLDFNLDLAKDMSSKNPVYYCQYAHARLNALLEIAQTGNYKINEEPESLTDEAEISLIKKLDEYKHAISEACKSLSPCKITTYCYELATNINEFYSKCRIIDPSDTKLTSSRLGLVKASKIVLKSAMELIGVSCPAHM